MKLSEMRESFRESVRNPAFEYRQTGLASLDKIFGGGLPEGLHVWSGAPGTGKTSLALQVAFETAKRGGNVLIFSLEMSPRYLYSRGVSREAYIDNPADPANPYAARLTKPNREKPFTAATLERYDVGEARFAEYCDRIEVDTETPFVTEIWKRVEEYVKATGTRPLVIVDHLRCLSVAGITDVYETERAAVAALKSMADGCHVAVILIATTNKGGLKSARGMDAVRGSTDVPFSADTLTLLAPGENGLVTASVVKNRDGACGSTVFRFRGEFGIFEDMDAAPAVAEEREESNGWDEEAVA